MGFIVGRNTLDNPDLKACVSPKLRKGVRAGR